MSRRRIPVDCLIHKRPSGVDFPMPLDLADLSWAWRGPRLAHRLSPGLGVVVIALD